MDIDEDDLKFLTEEEQKIIRNYHNSKLNIYQTPENNYLFKLKTDYNNSYEHREIQNNSAKYLLSPSNFVYYTLCSNHGSIYEAKREIQNNFNNSYSTSINTQPDSQLKKQIKEIKYKIIENRFSKDKEFQELCRLLNDKNFDKKMKEVNAFRNSVFCNRFFPFHIRADEIVKNYAQLLTPFIYQIVKEKIENNINDYF